jgi:hypothetical protein
MGQFTCSKCGLKAYSKNPATRNVFPAWDNLASTVLQATMSFKIEPDQYREGKNDLVIRHSLFKNEDLDEAIKTFHGLMQEVSLEDLKIATCCHDWEPVNGPSDYEV